MPTTQSQPWSSQSQFRSQSQSHEHVTHYGFLNLEDMHESTFLGISDIVDDGDILGLSGENELEVGQQFPNKEGVSFAVKTYNIQRSIEHKFLESDHTKYHGKCKHFRNGCSWSIHVTYSWKKGVWKIRKYNGPHTCLFALLSQDHPLLDTNVICANIFSMVQADPTISIKVRQGSMEAKYSFKTSYMKVWPAKQKAISKIHVRKSLIMNFENGYKVCWHLTQVQSFNW